VKVSAAVSPDELAGMTTGFSGADLANLVNEAALLATRRRANEVALTDFVQAIERLVAGLEKKNRILSPREREVVAFHEAGHALAALLTPGSDTIVKISIVPRGMGALGYLMQQPLEDRYLMSARELEDKLKVLFGGRAAEEIVFKEVSTGGASDLSRATEMARFMVTKYGMGKQVGLATYETDSSLFLGDGAYAPRVSVPHSEQTSRLIDEEVREILRRNYDATLEVLRRHRHALERVARALLERETLSAEEVREILERETGVMEAIAGVPMH
jgi:cell division protease FtsH